ncbi:MULTISPECIES: DUF7576 family protein [Haloarcula]|uniref:Small CPxCG-related zinc finger protein n=1 Tax=Haloarcula pellucida TaxID=1427151 RepID=A0A830GJZ7_9EURY|nr:MULTISPECIES: hypothetical protein [Halomicroarcula]MBX0347538.1 hypothetical protein [Halomicroarcula pellucida]MDS0276542.1 hypothetical protein [Halomicroarcula sp. S1AR25-4]QIO22973.1 hypothetical protein G9465_11680 [Haloarcula sp. JP-L23]GGN89169.1 hypothetical protein GCM10009030_09630 [Halomicroarcula pellucida]
MVDPTSDHHEDIDEADAPNCEVCGAAIANEVTHRVITWIEDDSVQTAHFCDDECRQQWDGA